MNLKHKQLYVLKSKPAGFTYVTSIQKNNLFNRLTEEKGFSLDGKYRTLLITEI